MASPRCGPIASATVESPNSTSPSPTDRRAAPGTMRRMAVTVLLPTLLRTHADGSPSVSEEGATVGEVFEKLIARYPGLAENLVGDDGRLHKFVNVYR